MIATRTNSSSVASLFLNRRFSLVYWSVVISFIAMKGIVRPFVLTLDAPQILDIIVLSYPNFCEAIVGSFVLVSMLRYINIRFRRNRKSYSDRSILNASILMSATYVITQEFKIHNLGGRNIYDPWDVVFSVVGLMASYVILNRILKNYG